MELVGEPPPPIEDEVVGELQRLREVEKQFKRLQMEHDLLKKAIRFVSERKVKSLPSSRQTGKPFRSK
jgi:transposase